MSTKSDDLAVKKLLPLGLNPKEARIYLALLEFGNQPASVLAKKTGLPKASVLFLLEGLVGLGYVRKSQKGRTQYFYADPKDLKRAKEAALHAEGQQLKEVLPLLEEFRNPFTAPPKLSFFEGLDACRKAYWQLLESSAEIREFGSHDDLEKMGEQFMADFIAERKKRKLFLKAICVDNPTHRRYAKLDKVQFRDCLIYPAKIGRIYSSIAIFEDKVLLLNLYRDAFAILIENKEVAETLRTIHLLIRGN